MSSSMSRVFVLALVMLMGLSACGFHLRGAALHERLSGRYFIQEAGAPEVASALRRQLEAQDRLVSVPGAADVVARLSSEAFTRDVVAVDAAGRATAYELRYVVKLSIENKSPSDTAQNDAEETPDQLSVVREHSYDETDVLGNQDEAELYRNEMRNELVRSLLVRLSLSESL